MRDIINHNVMNGPFIRGSDADVVGAKENCEDIDSHNVTHLSLDRAILRNSRTNEGSSNNIAPDHRARYMGTYWKMQCYLKTPDQWERFEESLDNFVQDEMLGDNSLPKDGSVFRSTINHSTNLKRAKYARERFS